MSSSNHTVSFLSCHRESVIWYLQLGSCKNEKRDNKQCLLDTPRRVTVNNKRLISKCKKSEKNMHIYKSHGIIKNYKEKLHLYNVALAPSS